MHSSLRVWLIAALLCDPEALRKRRVLRKLFREDRLYLSLGSFIGCTSCHLSPVHVLQYKTVHFFAYRTVAGFPDKEEDGYSAKLQPHRRRTTDVLHRIVYRKAMFDAVPANQPRSTSPPP